MDLLLDENNDLVFHNGPLTKEYTTQPFVQVVAQRLLIMLQTWQSEWFLDLTHGVPYSQWLGRKVPKQKVDQILQQKILAENGVKEIISWNSTFVNRKYTLVFQVRVIDGTISGPLVVSPIN